MKASVTTTGRLADTNSRRNWMGEGAPWTRGDVGHQLVHLAREPREEIARVRGLAVIRLPVAHRAGGVAGETGATYK